MVSTAQQNVIISVYEQANMSTATFAGKKYGNNQKLLKTRRAVSYFATKPAI